MNSQVTLESSSRRFFHGKHFRDLLCPRLLFLVCAVAVAQAEIDFTPVAGERELEGIVFKQLIFRDRGRKVTYEPPRGWTYSGGRQSLRLTPPDLANALAEIEQSPLEKPEPLDAAAKQALQARALAAIPPGAEQATVASEEDNPLRIDGRDTYGLTVNYVLGGQRYVANTLLVNFDDTQVRFRLVAKEKEFPAVFAAFRGSLYTLQWEQSPSRTP